MSHSNNHFYYHFVWRTKHSEPLLTSDMERIVYSYIRKRCKEEGVQVHALNGMPDHVHLVCSVPARMSVSDLMAIVKGATSHYVNHLPGQTRTLYWQAGYGGRTFSKGDLPMVVGYVQNQKIHHGEGKPWPSLECPVEKDGEVNGE